MMGRRNFRKRSGVIIDQCHEHGTWLDAHELERIAGFVLSGRADAASRAEAAGRDERDRQAARLAARRVEMGRFEPSASFESDSIFGGRRNSSGIGSILELLASFLD